MCFNLQGRSGELQDFAVGEDERVTLTGRGIDEARPLASTPTVDHLARLAAQALLNDGRQVCVRQQLLEDQIFIRVHEPLDDSFAEAPRPH